VDAATLPPRIRDQHAEPEGDPVRAGAAAAIRRPGAGLDGGADAGAWRGVHWRGAGQRHNVCAGERVTRGLAEGSPGFGAAAGSGVGDRLSPARAGSRPDGVRLGEGGVVVRDAYRGKSRALRFNVTPRL